MFSFNRLIRLTRHPFQTRISRHSQTRLNTRQFSTNTEKPDIANHFEIGLISLEIAFVVERQDDNFMSIIPVFWNVSLQGETGQEICSPNTNVHHPSFNCRRKEIKLKNSVNPGWMEPDSNYISLFRIN